MLEICVGLSGAKHFLFTYALMDIHRENMTFRFTSIPTAGHNLNTNTLEMTYL
jgi:hypothetical protein